MSPDDYAIAMAALDAIEQEARRARLRLPELYAATPAQDAHTPREQPQTRPGGTESGEGREGCSIGDRLRTEADDYDRAHNGESAFTATLRGLAHEADVLLTERDEWKRRRDAAVRECRFLHQDGLSRHDWHAKYCGAVEAADVLRGQVERVRTLVTETGGNLSCGGLSITADGCFAGDLARRILDALDPSSKAAPDSSKACSNSGEAGA